MVNKGPNDPGAPAVTPWIQGSWGAAAMHEETHAAPGTAPRRGAQASCPCRTARSLQQQPRSLLTEPWPGPPIQAAPEFLAPETMRGSTPLLLC